jgi:hypothetical protein
MLVNTPVVKRGTKECFFINIKSLSARTPASGLPLF